MARLADLRKGDWDLFDRHVNATDLTAEEVLRLNEHPEVLASMLDTMRRHPLFASSIVETPVVSLAAPANPMWKRINETTIEVNLDAAPKLPFDNATVEWPKQSVAKGWVKVELRDGKIFQNGREILLHLEKKQKPGSSMLGHDLRKALEGKDVLHPNVLDALYEAKLLPNIWERDEQGRIRYIFAWAVGFRASDGYLYVRYLYWNDGEWGWYYYWLGREFDERYPSALLASVP